MTFVLGVVVGVVATIVVFVAVAAHDFVAEVEGIVLPEDRDGV